MQCTLLHYEVWPVQSLHQWTNWINTPNNYRPYLLDALLTTYENCVPTSQNNYEVKQSVVLSQNYQGVLEEQKINLIQFKKGGGSELN